MEHRNYPVGREEPDGSFTYKSQITGEFVLASQYIAEVIVARKAKKDGIALPYKYWNDGGAWAKEFKGQVAQAAILLRKYSAKAIIVSLLQLSWCYSLRQPKLVGLIIQNNNKIIADEKVAKQNVIEIVDENSHKVMPTKKKSMLTALMEE